MRACGAEGAAARRRGLTLKSGDWLLLQGLRAGGDSDVDVVVDSSRLSSVIRLDAAVLAPRLPCPST